MNPGPRKNSIKVQGLKKHLDMTTVLGYAVFRIAVDNGVSELNIGRLFGRPGHPKNRVTVRKWIEADNAEKSAYGTIAV